MSEEEDKRIWEKVKSWKKAQQRAYHEGYGDAILYTNKLTTEIYQYMIKNGE